MLKFTKSVLVIASVLSAGGIGAHALADQPTVRVATYNSSLFRDDATLIRDLENGDDQQARRIAEVIQRVRPDVILVNEFDYDADGRAAKLFVKKYLAVGQNGCQPVRYLGNQFSAPVNTGRPSGRDLNKDDRLGGPADAIGFGRHEGQYGMLVLSRFAIDAASVRTFQKFLWRDMRGALLPIDPSTGQPYYDDDDLAVLRLSSKSFWDVPVQVPAGDGRDAWTLHLLCSHPTPPVFDGPEDRNGRRNHDEIRLVADYIDPNKSDYLLDDAGRRGGLPADALFVIVGDLNADPVDGDSLPGAMEQLLKHPRVNASFTPSSTGGRLATEQNPDANAAGQGDPSHDTADFGDFQSLRVDYALPSRGLVVVDGGVFWPTPGEPTHNAITATDHRLVWIELRVQ